MPRERILITEDEIVVAEDLRVTLTGMGYQVAGVASSKSEAIAMAESTHPDLVLMDIQLNGLGDGIGAAAEINDRHRIPVVFLTAHADQATLNRAKETLPFGYVVKPFEEHGLRASIETALRLHEAQAALSRVERWMATTLRSIGDGVISTDVDGLVTFLNPRAEQITGWTCSEAEGKPLKEIFPLIDEESRKPIDSPVDRALSLGVQVNLAGNTILLARNGTEIPIDDSAAPLREESGRISGVVLVFRDSSQARRDAAERDRLQQRMQEAQRLESLGLVAGGVAHDFNNLLTAIMGNAHLARASLPEDSAVAPLLSGIEESSARAADICQQMLTYVGRHQTVLLPVDFNDVVVETLRILRGSFNSQVEIVLQLPPGLPAVYADRTQIQQLAMNLILNAVEALCGTPGIVTISSAVVELDRASLQEATLGAEIEPGRYLQFEVSDNGCGMSVETLSKIFDPFFSTKFTGRGLGLASVHGIVRAHKAAVFVRSQLGFGSSLKVALPLAPEAAPIVPSERRRARYRGEGPVLIIEDEPTVLFIIARIVERMGFQPITAADGPSALVIAREKGFSPKLILLDANMPKMDGLATLRELRQVLPTTPVILVSALPEEAANERFATEKIDGILRKPFRPDQLERKIGEVFA